MKLIKKELILVFLILLIIRGINAEILVQGNSALEDASSLVVSADRHTFLVNTYQPEPIKNQTVQVLVSGIVIEPITSEAVLEGCGRANLSFKLTNPTSKKQLYSFEATDFSGRLYITPNLLLEPKKSRIIKYSLAPECSESEELNPKIIVQTEEEYAEIPVILEIHLEEQKPPENILDQNSCEFYYEKNICESSDYLRFEKGKTFKIDLAKWFYDPDEDNLEFSSKTGINIDIEIKGNEAKLSPKTGWYGAETVVFYAKDGKGGKAESRKFYVQVTKRDKPKFFLFDLFAGLFSQLLIL